MRISFNKLTSFLLPVLVFTFFSCAPEEDIDELPSDVRDNYIGNWTCSENSKQFQNSTYSVHVKKSTTNSNQLLFGNFYQLGADTFSKINLINGVFEIPMQTVSGNLISGNGNRVSDIKINLSFIVDDGGSVLDSVTAVLTK